MFIVSTLETKYQVPRRGIDDLDSIQPLAIMMENIKKIPLYSSYGSLSPIPIFIIKESFKFNVKSKNFLMTVCFDSVYRAAPISNQLYKSIYNSEFSM